MKIAYTTVFDAHDVHNWSGTPFYMANHFEKAGLDVDYIGSLKRKLPPFFKLKQWWNGQFHKQRESPRFNVHAATHYSLQVAKKINEKAIDFIISPQINPIAYLETKKPLILWTDALYAGLQGFYPPFAAHSKQTIAAGHEITKACLARCDLAIFSSEWAANTAIDFYNTPSRKVKVVPFGANLESAPSQEEIHQFIKNRCENKIKLLFLAKSWERKGGDLVLAVAKALYEAHIPIELTIVGYHPPNLNPIPEYIKCLGFISKNSKEGKEKIRDILSQTHFLFVPSRAEAYGIVFCEANAFAVPCISTSVGGIDTVIKNNINGMKFKLDATIDDYCDYIIKTMRDRMQYNNLARSSYLEYLSRLNWQTATKAVIELI